MKRVFAIDVLVCDACGGAMRILAVLPEGDASRAILAHLGLPSEPPHPVPAYVARRPPIIFPQRTKPPPVGQLPKTPLSFTYAQQDTRKRGDPRSPALDRRVRIANTMRNIGTHVPSTICMMLDAVGLRETVAWWVLAVLATIGCATFALRPASRRSLANDGLDVGVIRRVWFLGYLVPHSIAQPMPRAYRLVVARRGHDPVSVPVSVWYRGEMRDASCYTAVYVAGHPAGDHFEADLITPDVTKYPGECWLLRCVPESLDLGRRTAATKACANDTLNPVEPRFD